MVKPTWASAVAQIRTSLANGTQVEGNEEDNAGNPQVEEEKAELAGHRVTYAPQLLELTNVRLLAEFVNPQQTTWLIPKEKHLELLFFHKIFNHLRQQSTADLVAVGFTDVQIEEWEIVTFEAFQRALERLFYILRDSDSFDAKMYDENGDGFVSWAEFFRVYKKQRIAIKLSLCERIYLTLDSPESCHLAMILSNTILLLIVLSSFSFVMSTLPECRSPDEQFYKTFCEQLKSTELFFLVVFTAEYLVRLGTVWGVRSMIFDKYKFLEAVIGYDVIHLESRIWRLLVFVVAPSNIVDALAILPGILSRLTSTQGGAFVFLRLVRLTRILRAFKSPALAEAVRVISKTMARSTQALYILLFNLMLGIVIFGSLMYMAEGGPELNAYGYGATWNADKQVFERVVSYEWDPVNGDWLTIMEETPFQSIPHGCWWAMTTAATVGYGDAIPTTVTGKLVAVSCIVFSLVILALPVGVISGTFSTVWEEADKERHQANRMLKRDTEYLAFELARLDPASMLGLMLLEVYHDQPGLPVTEGGRPPESCFMGEAKLNLNLPPDAPMSEVCVVQLKENSDIVRRSVTGKITLKYDWVPASTRGSRLLKSASFHSGPGPIRLDVQGQLTITLLCGEELINLGAQQAAKKGTQQQLSSPYCLLLCYPTLEATQETPQACVWRSPTASNTLQPRWNAMEVFDFNWCKEQQDLQSSAGAPRASIVMKEPPKLGGADPLDLDRSKMDDILLLAKEMRLELALHKTEVSEVCMAVTHLSRKVEQINRRAEQIDSYQADAGGTKKFRRRSGSLPPPVDGDWEDNLDDEDSIFLMHDTEAAEEYLV